MRVLACTLLTVLALPSLHGQDIHFSQYGVSSLNLNPAFTGFFDGDYRVNGIYRSQWSSVPVPFSTFSFGGDMRTRFKSMRSDRIGIGVLFNNDKAGDANYGTNQLYLSGSYIHKMTADSNLLLSAGLAVGISNLGFQFNKMTFDSQYDGSGYNPGYATGENFNKFSTTYADINAGIALQYNFMQRGTVQYGFSYNHLTSPNVSFNNDKSVRLDNKLNNYLSVSMPVAKQVDLIGEILYSQQGKSNEIVPGLQCRYILDNRNYRAVSLGLYYRVKDAGIARVGYQFQTLSAGLSYDMNTSRLIAASNRRGGIELYITYIFKRIVPYIAKQRVCPVYM